MREINAELIRALSFFPSFFVNKYNDDDNDCCRTNPLLRADNVFLSLTLFASPPLSLSFLPATHLFSAPNFVSIHQIKSWSREDGGEEEGEEAAKKEKRERKKDRLVFQGK